ncbi:hypothetical protein Clacol_002843 [Clathrus columnatus]|uniref:PH domain-containing protein n=1 Tax=Clathrus columnatus TaxID=1419009 RepID=A0AAV5A1W6_9AGAM|nr:hypothetical protein Clacol_002843 [Clathrus columnatus]
MANYVAKPVLFGFVYSETAGTFPKSIFVVAAVLLITASVLFTLLKTDVVKRPDEDSEARFGSDGQEETNMVANEDDDTTHTQEERISIMEKAYVIRVQRGHFTPAHDDGCDHYFLLKHVIMNHERGDGTLSRATSISRASRPTSSLSRNQSLIKKNVAPHDLRPSDILIEGIADIENNTARELTKLAGVIQVPFRSGNQFLGEGGMQDVYYGIRDKTRVMSDHHANLGRTIDGSIVQHLQKLRLELKAHIKNVQNDTGKLATNVAKERELSAKLIAELQKSIVQYKNTPMTVVAREDPYVANMQVVRQLQKQVNEENALQKSIIIMQQNSAHFEEGIVRSIQSAWQTFDEWQSRMSSQVQDTWRNMSLSMAALAPDREWISFAARSDHMLDPDTPLRNPETVEYPSKEDPSVIAVHTGLLERKKRFTRSYKESYYVLTAAGYLHEFASSDPRVALTPTFSLFLPACTLGPPSSASRDKSHKFHIEGKKDGTGTIRGGSILSRREHAYTFRARSHDEMMEWWNDIRMLVARYLVASEQIERHGPVAAAVRAAGYLSEEEEEIEEEGSSFEADINGGASAYHDAREAAPVVVDESSETLPPSYSHRKDLTENTTTTIEGYAADKKQALDAPYLDTNETGGNISRNPSQRQMEKAPENREHLAQNNEIQSGPALPNTNSKFKETI